ncbi:MAG: hypothetical protein S4CHLAM102_09250 [Chlamydiia bacterium]|nr:hypothetical protein [Chlamydiia bacterium]
MLLIIDMDQLIKNYKKSLIKFHKNLTSHLLGIEQDICPGHKHPDTSIVFNGSIFLHQKAQEFVETTLQLDQTLKNTPPPTPLAQKEYDKIAKRAKAFETINWDTTNSWLPTVAKQVLINYPQYENSINYCVKHYPTSTTYTTKPEKEYKPVIETVYNRLLTHKATLHSLSTPFILSMHAITVNWLPGLPYPANNPDFTFKGIRGLYLKTRRTVRASRTQFKELEKDIATFPAELFTDHPYLRLAYEKEKAKNNALQTLEWEETKDWLPQLCSILVQCTSLNDKQIEHILEKYPRIEDYE